MERHNDKFSLLFGPVDYRDLVADTALFPGLDTDHPRRSKELVVFQVIDHGEHVESGLRRPRHRNPRRVHVQLFEIGGLRESVAHGVDTGGVIELPERDGLPLAAQGSQLGGSAL